MKSILILYYSRGGHTQKISQSITTQVETHGYQCDMLDIGKALEEGVDFDKYDGVVLGSCVLYGTYDKSVFEFTTRYQEELTEKGVSFFSVNVVARKPEKRVPENNKYLQNFLTLSNWKPKDVKIIAGKVDYPSWRWFDRLAIQFIMKMTGGPTDSKAVIDYTDWDDVKVYADHLVSLVD